MIVLYYLVFVSMIVFVLFTSGVVLATVDLVKHRRVKEKLDYKNHLIHGLSISVIAFVIFIVCIAVLKVLV